MSLPKPSRNQQLAIGVVILIALVVVGAVAWGFGQQIALARRIQADEIRLEQAVAAEQARHDELVAQLEYVQSDEYVERWARTERRMVRPGEVAVVVLKDWGEEPTAEARPTPTPEPQDQPFWVEWWELAFGQGR